MKHQVQKLPKSQIKISAELTSDEFETFVQKALDDAKRQMHVPGFRPGKAPSDVVEKRLDKNHLLSEAGEHALMDSVNKIVRDEKWETVGEPAIEIKKIARGSEFVFDATITLLPETTLGSWTKVKVSRTPIQVEEGEVQKVIESLRKQRAIEQAVDHPATKGNRVEMEYEMFVGGLRTEEGLQKGDKITLGEDMFVPEFEQNLLGTKKGDKKTFTITYKADYPQKRFAGKAVEFRVNVLGVYEVVLPEATDEWAKTVGQFDNLAALTKAIRENIEAEKTAKENERVEEEAMEAVIKHATYAEIPDLLLDSEADKMIDELKASVSQQGMEFPKYLEMLKKTEQDLKKELAPKAEKRVKSALALREIVRAEKLDVTDDEIQNELQLVLAEHQGHDAKEVEYFKGAEFRRRMENVILSRKAVQRIKDQIVGS